MNDHATRSTDEAATAPTLSALLNGLPHQPQDVVLFTDHERVTLAELRSRIDGLAQTLHDAGIRPGHAIGNIVGSGASGVVAMFAAWAVGGVYVPINNRYTDGEIASLVDEAAVAVVMGEPSDLTAHEIAVTAVAHENHASRSHVVRSVPTPGALHDHDHDLALVLRTSGTTGRPKAVLLRHSGTLESIDSSLAELRRRRPAAPHSTLRATLVPVSLALWAGVYNTLFSLRAGFGVVLFDRFSPQRFLAVIREHHITSTVLPPAMLTMLIEAEEITDLSPLRMVRSITAPLSPATARRFHERFGVFVLNSYGQTELGGEVVGWTAEDVRGFGETKLGAVGRPYANIELRIIRPDGSDAAIGEHGEVLVRSPYRMSGYASGDIAAQESADDRFVDGYLHTGDIGSLDHDGFLWLHGRVSDMINRGGLKIFPDEVEETLRRHPRVRDAGVAGVPDERLGEVPHAWVITDGPVDATELEAWCREHLVPYKVPVGFTAVDRLPRTDVGKVLRRQLVVDYNRAQETDGTD